MLHRITLILIILLAVLSGCSDFYATTGGYTGSTGTTGATGTSGYTGSPSVIFSYPAISSSGIPVESTLYVTFDRLMDVGTFLPGSVKLVSDSGSEVTLTAVNNLTQDCMAITHPALDISTGYTLYLTTSLKDMDGNPLDTEVAIHFTTAADANPDFTAPVAPSLYDPAPRNGRVVFNWNTPADADVVYIQISDGSSSYKIPNGVNWFEFMGLTDGTSYTFSVTAVDAAGNSSSPVTVTATPRSIGYPITDLAGDDAQIVLRFFHPVDSFPIGVDDNTSQTISLPFAISETEITYKQWYTVRKWAVTNNFTFSNSGYQGSAGDGLGGAPTDGSQPATGMTWYDAIVWCNALTYYANTKYYAGSLGYVYLRTSGGTVINDATDMTQFTSMSCDPTKSGFRLPDTYEWEAAARFAGYSQPGPWAIGQGGCWWAPGKHASGAADNVYNSTETGNYAWYNGNAPGSTQVVATRNLNAMQLSDMAGNASEWTYTSPGGTESVIRGGSANSAVEPLQNAAENTMDRSTSDVYNGFRVVRGGF